MQLHKLQKMTTFTIVAFVTKTHYENIPAR